MRATLLRMAGARSVVMVLSIGDDSQDRLAVTGFGAVRVACGSEREHVADDRAEHAGVDQARDLGQLIAPRLDDEERALVALALGVLLGGGDRDEGTARQEQVPRALERLAADR